MSNIPVGVEIGGWDFRFSISFVVLRMWQTLRDTY